MTTRTLPLLFLLAACTTETEDTGTPWEDPCPVLQVRPEVVEWDLAPVGYEWGTEVQIENACDGESLLVVDFAVEGDDAFYLLDDSVTVPPGEGVPLDLWFLAEDEVPHTATLLAKVHGEEAVPIELRATGTRHVDRDEDGYVDRAFGGADCDDTNASVYPAAPELLDLVDNDCDDLVDEDWFEAGDVLITEVMVDPVATPDARGEWLELTNLSGRDLDLSGWEIIDYSYHDRIVFDPPFLVLADMRVVIGPEGQESLNGGVEVDRTYRHEDLDLDDTYDDLELRAGDLTVAAVTWDADWWIGTPGAAWSLDPRITDVWEALNRTYWCSAVEPLPSGDFGTPGRANPVCDLANDDDGDGWTVGEGDCDDTDPEVHPEAEEVWGNRTDDDCDGISDLALADDVAAGFLDGGDNARLAWRNNLGTGDLDGDGRAELVVGSWLGEAGQGAAWILEGADYASWAGSIEDRAEARWIGPENQDLLNKNALAYMGAVSPVLGDVTGDGIGDLVVGGTDVFETGDSVFAGVALLSGPLSGDYRLADATATVVQSQGYTNTRVHSGLDLDDDGVAEMIYAEGWGLEGDAADHRGHVSVFSGGSGLSGEVVPSDADHRWIGAEEESYLGTQVAGGDLDGDGHDDLVLAAWGEDTAGTGAGATYILSGDALPADGEIAWTARILGDATDNRLGRGGVPQVADLDGDGDADLALSAHMVDRVFLFLDAGSLSGTWSASDADVSITGLHGPHELGVALGSGDLDGDGVADLLVGAPDDDQYHANYAWYEGAALVFYAPGAGPARQYMEDAGTYIEDDDPQSGFGHSALVADLDGDGRVEALVGATNEGAFGAGRVWLFSL